MAALATVQRDGSRRLLAAVDAKAAALGLHPGLAVSDAQARVPDLLLHPATPDQDAQALQALAQWCARRFSPIAAASPPSSIALDIAGAEHLFGGEGEMLVQICARLQRAGLSVRAAAAPNPAAAAAFAQYAAAPTLRVHAQDLTHLLGGLPVAALQLSPEGESGLRALGFATLAPLLAAPRAPLARRFGHGLLRRIDLLLGRIQAPIGVARSTAEPVAQQHFAAPLITADALHAALERLVQRLITVLTRQGLGAVSLHLSCLRCDHSEQHVQLGLSAASRDGGHMLRLLRLRLESITPEPGIERMVLRANTVQLDAARLPGMLDAPGSHADLSGLADILSSRLDGAPLQRAMPTHSQWPERALRISTAATPPDKTAPLHWPDDLPRPARLVQPPCPINVTALLPDHPPAQFVWQGKRHRVCRADGPERIGAEWWEDGADAAELRDYFMVEDADGQRFWLFRRGDGSNPQSGDFRWFLHGIFA